MKRPYFLKIVIGTLTALLSFITSMTLILAVIWVIQRIYNDIEIVGAPAIILLIIGCFISGYLAFVVTKWQNKILDIKSKNINYIVLAVLIILIILLLPTPMIYLYY